MSAPIPILAQLKPHGRHVMSLKAAECDIRRPDRSLGQRPIWGDKTGLSRLSKDDANRQRAPLQKHVAQLQRIASLHRQGKDDELKEVVAETLSSRAAKASALVRFAYSEECAFSGAQLQERLAKLNVYACCNDPVRLNIQPKDDGSGRPTLDFGWNHKCRQLMVRDVIYAAGVGNEFDHNFRGLGPERAIRRIVEAIEAGYVWWLTADIKNCFASVKLEHIHGMLPIPSNVLKKVVFIPTSVPIHSHHGDHVAMTIDQEARRGLPQGSIVSAPLASALLGREIRTVMSEIPGVALTFADDIAIGARTQEQIKSIEHAIGERFASLSGGPLIFKYIKIGHAASGIDFIQRRIVRHQWDGQYDIRVQPSPSAFHRLKKKLLAEYGGAFELGQAWEQSPDGLKERIQKWAAAMGWKMQPDWEEAVLIFCIAH